MKHSLLQIQVLLLAAVLQNTASFSVPSSKKGHNAHGNIQYRQGAPQDERKIASTLLKELMNPLGIQSERFVVATTRTSSDESVLVGWAQIKPLGSNPATANIQRDPSQFDARPGSYSLDQELDDDMWDDFERDDSIVVPTGWASLPWTKEYRALQKAVQDRNIKREALRQKREQELVRNSQNQLWELSSVYVEAPYRGQGIGTELVRRVIRQRLAMRCLPTNIYLLTLATTTSWYESNFGFEIVKNADVPAPMTLEVAAGNLVTKLIGAQLCCMRGTDHTIELCS